MVWIRAALAGGDAVLVRLLLEGIIVLEGLGEDGTVHLGTGQDGVRLAGQLLLEPGAPGSVLIFHRNEDGVGQLVHIARF